LDFRPLAEGHPNPARVAPTTIGRRSMGAP
jgi:hypothetical protein